MRGVPAGQDSRDVDEGECVGGGMDITRLDYQILSLLKKRKKLGLGGIDFGPLVDTCRIKCTRHTVREIARAIVKLWKGDGLIDYRERTTQCPKEEAERYGLEELYAYERYDLRISPLGEGRLNEYLKKNIRWWMWTIVTILGSIIAVGKILEFIK